MFPISIKNRMTGTAAQADRYLSLYYIAVFTAVLSSGGTLLNQHLFTVKIFAGKLLWVLGGEVKL